jgi:co-chaperonin GroES (HSP10)
MSTVANEVADLAVHRAEQTQAVNADYDEIRSWLLHQRKWYVRLGNWLLRKHPVHPKLPMVPKYWRVLVMIRKPDEVSAGGILLVKDSLDAEAYLTYVGMVVAQGRLAYKAVTRAGLKLSRERNPRLGETVVFYKNAGTRFATTDGHMFVLLTDTEIWATTDNPERLDTMAL